MGIHKRALGAVTAAAAALVVLAGCSSSKSTPAAAPANPSTAAGNAASGGAWALPSDMSAAATKAGLEMLGQEELAVHYHAHLDVVDGGKPVTVPAYIGIDLVQQKISALHTHDASGVIHIESAKDNPFKLGQVFTEWGQPLSATQVGPEAIGGDKALHVFVNGKEAAGDPADIVLHAHDEIVVWIGAAADKPSGIPSSYAFPAGE